MKLFRLIIIFQTLLLFTASPVYSETELSFSGFTIKSDESDINLKTGIRKYSGNVKIKHLNLHLEADEVIEYRDGSKILKIIAIGTPAKFWQTPPEIVGLKNGEAENIEYIAENRILNLTDFDVIDLYGNVMQGKNATYHLQ